MSILLITAAALFGFSVGLVAILRTNAGVMFLAACSGVVLLGSIDPVVISTAGAVVPSEGEAYVRLSVVALSVVFAALVFKKSVHGLAIGLHMLIASVMSVVLLLLLPERTGVSWLLSASDDSLWLNLSNYLSLIVATGFASSLFAIYSVRHGKTKKDKKIKH